MFVILLDPYIASNFLIKKFDSKGIEIYAYYFLDSDNAANESEDTGSYKNKIIFDSKEIQNISLHINSLIEEKGENNLLGIIPCDELMSDVHHNILTQIHFSKNKPNHPISVWNNKFSAQEILYQNGFSNYKQSTILLDKVEKVDLKMFTFPVFVKPNIFGVGTIGAKKCDSQKELNEHLNTLKSFKNPLGRAITEVVIQDFVIGTEIVIDNVSLNGIHSCVGIHQYEKTLVNGEPKYITAKPIYDELLLTKYREYSKNVLNLLEFKTGPSHMEVMVGENGALYFIELNPRFSGAQGSLNYLSKLGFDNDQVEELVRMYSSQSPKGLTKTLNNKVKAFFFYAPKEGYSSINEEILKSFSPIEIMKTHDHMAPSGSENDGLFRIGLIVIFPIPNNIQEENKMHEVLFSKSFQQQLFCP